MSVLKKGIVIKDRYLLLEYLGQGGYGEVWLAHDQILNNNVAIKIYVPLDPDGVAEFKNDFVKRMDVTHPALLTPKYLEVWESHPFLITKFMPKGSVKNMLGMVKENEMWRMIRDVASGLAYLHSLPEPIVHQELRPDNILVDDDGSYKLSDFGVSYRLRQTLHRQSGGNLGNGSIPYMAPERFSEYPEPVKASDIWALGATLYQIVTGKLPFGQYGGGMQRNGSLVPTLSPSWSDDLVDLMRACMSLEPWDRPRASQIEDYARAKCRGENPQAPWRTNSAAQPQAQPTPAPAPAAPVATAAMPQPVDPYAPQPKPIDPYAPQQPVDPYAPQPNPYAPQQPVDPYAPQPNPYVPQQPVDPYAPQHNPYVPQQPVDPYAPQHNPYAPQQPVDPYAPQPNPYPPQAADPYGQQQSEPAEPQNNEVWNQTYGLKDDPFANPTSTGRRPDMPSLDSESKYKTTRYLKPTLGDRIKDFVDEFKTPILIGVAALIVIALIFAGGKFYTSLTQDSDLNKGDKMAQVDEKPDDAQSVEQEEATESVEEKAVPAERHKAQKPEAKPANTNNGTKNNVAQRQPSQSANNGYRQPNNSNYGGTNRSQSRQASGYGQPSSGYAQPSSGYTQPTSYNQPAASAQPSRQQSADVASANTPSQQTPTQSMASSNSGSSAPASSSKRVTKPTSAPKSANIADAVNRGDYGAVKAMADAGSAEASGVMAEYYLSERSYVDADKYARRAKSGGDQRGDWVVRQLEVYGFYE